MKTLRNTLYISLTLQICLAAAIMAAAEEAPLALITIPVALGSLIAIDLLGWLKPPGLLLNLAGLISLGVALAEFRQQGESRLLAGGHLIVYLTWTFLLQVKVLRRMWWMFALSVLQVAVGAVLTNQPWFGAALFVYTASAVWTMSLLSLTRAALLADPHLLSKDPDLGEGEIPTSTPQAIHSFAWNSVRTDEQGRWISPRFLGGGLLTFLLILVVGVSFFVLTPRVWIGNFDFFGDSPLRGKGGATGFTENVKLGDIGEVMESHELVMEVRVLDRVTRQAIPPADLAAAVGGEPLLRGAVLDYYEAGSWKKGEYRWQESYGMHGPIQLDITLQPLHSAILFYTGHFEGARGLTAPETIYFDRASQVVEREDESDMSAPYSYAVSVTPPGSRGNPNAIEMWNRALRWNRIPEDLQRLLPTPTDRLTQLAQQVVEQATPRGAAPGREVTARVLETYLRDSGEFSYTLDLSVDDPTIDPVEDFVFNRKKGHCEYFASALALMFRGVGIPSRLISGFKGAEYNPKTGQLEVRALHAHAWVEGFVDGAWVTFDPTPGERDMEVATKAKDSAPDLVDKTRSAWFQGMSYSKSQQDELVYAPLRNLGDSMKNNLAGLMQGNLPLLSQLKELSATPSLWLSGQGGAMAGFLLLTLFGTIWLGRVLLKRWKGWTRDRELAQRRATTVEFYSRFLALLQRFGLTEIQTLTPREFAGRAEEQFQSRFRTARITGLALTLVESFYAVRFGDQLLSVDQLQAVDHQLIQLEKSLSAPAT